MRHLALLTAFAGILLLAGCASPNDVDAANKIKAMAPPTAGTAFNRALFEEYKSEAKNEAEVEFEWDDAAIFARKGLAAAAGETVEPEKLASWLIPAGRVDELAKARELLVADLAAGAGERLPAIAAKAQAKFDCWVEEEREGDTTSDCRKQFLTLEPQLRAPMVAAPAPAKIVKTFIVYFDFNKADITAAARITLDEVSVSQAQIKPTNIYVSGHTDTVGTSDYNNRLSARRAQAVTDALANRGVKSGMFDIKTFGKDKPAVPTGDNVNEPRNRRVEIYFEK